MAQQNDRYRRARQVFGLLFILSTCLLIVFLLFFRSSEPDLEISGSHNVLDWISDNLGGFLSLLSSVASLIGLASTTYLQWRAERRESKTALLERQRQQLEIEKLKLQLGKQETKDEDDDHQTPH